MYQSSWPHLPSPPPSKARAGTGSRYRRTTSFRSFADRPFAHRVLARGCHPRLYSRQGLEPTGLGAASIGIVFRQGRQAFLERRVEDITEALWGTRVSSGTVSNSNRKVYAHIERWRNQAIEGDCAYVYLDGLALKRSWSGGIKNVSIVAAIGVDEAGYRRVLGVAEGHKEDKAGWLGFLKHLKKRGLSGVRLIVSDACLGLVEASAEVFPEADWQRCTVHFYRNVFSHVPHRKVRKVAAMLKAIHAQESRSAAQAKAEDVIGKLKAMKSAAAAELVANGIGETLTYYSFSSQHRWNDCYARRAGAPKWSAPFRMGIPL